MSTARWESSIILLDFIVPSIFIHYLTKRRIGIWLGPHHYGLLYGRLNEWDVEHIIVLPNVKSFDNLSNYTVYMSSHVICIYFDKCIGIR